MFSIELGPFICQCPLCWMSIPHVCANRLIRRNGRIKRFPVRVKWTDESAQQGGLQPFRAHEGLGLLRWSGCRSELEAVCRAASPRGTWCQLAYYIDPLAEIDTKTIGRFESVRGPVCAGLLTGECVEEAVFPGSEHGESLAAGGGRVV